ncbi:MAG: ROK family protein [Clostridium sp.]|nr:ROK family protein [Clostridium sp.]
MDTMVFDVGGSEIKYCVMDDSLERRHYGSVATPRDTQEHFFEVLRKLYLPFAHKTCGIALSLPGIIDSEKGICLGNGYLRYNWGSAVGPALAEYCGCPVFMANDAKCAAYAELSRGVLRGVRNAAVYIIGSGVGGGIIINGSLVNGPHFSAGEFSQMRYNSDRWEESEGSAGGRLGIFGLFRKYLHYAGLPEDTPVDGKLIFARYHEGEAAAVRSVEEFCLETAKMIANISVLLDCEKIAVGGGISRDPAVTELIARNVAGLYDTGANIWMSGFTAPEVVPCRFGSDANLVGAYLLGPGRTGQQGAEDAVRINCTD